MKRDIRKALTKSKKTLESFYSENRYNKFYDVAFTNSIKEFDIVMSICMHQYGFIVIPDRELFCVMKRYETANKDLCESLYPTVKEFLEGEYLKEVKREIGKFEHGKF